MLVTVSAKKKNRPKRRKVEGPEGLNEKGGEISRERKEEGDDVGRGWKGG
jgi:hypothetical protein